MTYLLAVLGLVAVAFLLWRAFGPQRDGADDAPEAGGYRGRPRGPLGPDDDPDFLRDLDNRTRGHAEGDDL